jgi:DNA polymerase-3 subunit epsilon
MDPVAARDLAQRLGLTRPLVFLDLETTGTSVAHDRIVEIAVTWLSADGDTRTVTRRVNPGMPIPAEATARHGISDEDVAEERPFSAFAKSLHAQLVDCDFAGFGIVRFDLPLLQAELARAGVEFEWSGSRVIDAMTIYHTLEPRDLAAASRFYLDEPLAEQPSAGEHNEAGMAVLAAQLDRYEELPGDLAGLDAFCNPERADWIDSSGRFAWRDREAVLTFGRYEGTPLRQIAEERPDYLEWLLRQDFPRDTKEVAGRALEGEFPALPMVEEGTGDKDEEPDV